MTLDPRTATGEGARPPRLDYLDGVRALAALFVVVSHGGCFSLGVADRTGLVGLATDWMFYGHLAVGLFIVLSGFCLMLPFVQRPAARLHPADFFRRRVRRILPPLYIAMLLCIAMKVVGDRLGLVPNNIDARVLLLNVFLLQDVFPEANQINAVFWSVALEFKIYLLFPLLLGVHRRYGAGAVLLLAGGIGYGLTALLLALRPGMHLNHTCPWYVFLFAMGMCGAAATFAPGAPPAAARSRAATLAWGGALAASALATLVLLQAFPVVEGSGEIPRFAAGMPLIDPVAGAGFTALLVLLGSFFRVRGALPRRIGWLGARPLVFVGTISYSLYLIHQPFVHLISDLQQHFLAPRTPQLAVNAPLGALLYFAVMLPLALGGSYLFFLLFERPFIGAPRKRPPAAPEPTPEAAPVTPAVSASA